MSWYDDLILKGSVKEKRDSMSLSYILEDSELFSMTGYRVLRSQEERGLVHCSKVLHNGKDKLVYNISAYKPLTLLLQVLGPDIVLAIVRNLMEVVITVKNNGFIKFDSIAVSIDKIFVDTSNYKVFLVYLPIYVESSSDSYSVFECQLKEKLIREISQYTNLAVPSIRKMRDAMRNNAVSIEELRGIADGLIAGAPNDTADVSGRGGVSMTDYINKSIQDDGHRKTEPDVRRKPPASGPVVQENDPARKRKGLFGKFLKPEWQKADSSFEQEQTQIFSTFEPTEIISVMKEGRSITLVGLNTPGECRIYVSKESFVIGRNTEKVDYAVTFSKAIGREHCRLTLENEGWYVEDLNSSNGTFLNGARLTAGKPAAIKAGDKLRLADIYFEVK